MMHHKCQDFVLIYVRGTVPNFKISMRPALDVEAFSEFFCDVIDHYFDSFGQCLQEKEWFAKNFEQIQNEVLSNECRVQSCKLMLKSQVCYYFH